MALLAAAPLPRLTRIAEALRRNQALIQRGQWGVVAVYVVLLVVPAILPMPPREAHIWTDLTLFAQFTFWGLWWPGVLLSMVLFGRAWCGLLCPEGALTEVASRHGQHRAIPAWIKWKGWPFAAFVMTTVYGQMVSVYQYPAAALLVLGGSTVAAVVVGARYGKAHRVWCRHLCPVGGVFGLLAKLSPVHFAADPAAWAANRPSAPVHCAPLVPLKGLNSASACQMCGRCAGFRGAITLKSRTPGSEVVQGRATTWDAALVLTGLMGVATGAFLWAASPWFVTLKLSLADWLVARGWLWPLQADLPWFILTNAPERNDVMTVLDGVSLLIFVTATALAMTLALGLPLAGAAALAGRGTWARLCHFSLGLLPLAAAGVILGLSGQSVSLLRADGFRLLWVPEARDMVLALASGWSLWLVWGIAGQYRKGTARGAMTALGAVSVGLGLIPWALLFHIW